MDAGVLWYILDKISNDCIIPAVELQRLGEFMSGHTPEHMQSFADRHLHVVAVNWHQRAVSKICGLSCTLILFVCLLCSDVKTEYETIKVVPCFSGCLSPLVLYPVSLPHGEPTFQPVSICSVPVVVRYYTQTSSVMAPALLLLQSTCPLPLACGVSCNVSR